MSKFLALTVFLFINTIGIVSTEPVSAACISYRNGSHDCDGAPAYDTGDTSPRTQSRAPTLGNSIGTPNADTQSRSCISKFVGLWSWSCGISSGTAQYNADGTSILTCFGCSNMSWTCEGEDMVAWHPGFGPRYRFQSDGRTLTGSGCTGTRLNPPGSTAVTVPARQEPVDPSSDTYRALHPRPGEGPGTAKGCWNPLWNSNGEATDQGAWVPCANQRGNPQARTQPRNNTNMPVTREIAIAMHYKEVVKNLRASGDSDAQIRETLKKSGLSPKQIESAMGTN